MAHQYYHVCRSHVGRAVSIRCRDGRDYRGKVSRVTEEHVYLSSLGSGISGGETRVEEAAKTAVTTNKQEKGSEVFFFFPIIPLAAIAGITLIATAPFWGPRYGPYGGGFFW